MKELVVLSGKGGTGKTSVTASLAALAEQPALADCDVDASNLPLVLDPRLRRRETFIGGLRARIKPGLCTACGKCGEVINVNAEARASGTSHPLQLLHHPASSKNVNGVQLEGDAQPLKLAKEGGIGSF